MSFAQERQHEIGEHAPTAPFPETTRALDIKRRLESGQPVKADEALWLATNYPDFVPRGRVVPAPSKVSSLPSPAIALGHEAYETSAVGTPEQQAYVRSKAFYEQLGHPEFAGVFAPFEAPEGYHVADISKTAEGTLRIALEKPPEELPSRVPSLASRLLGYRTTPLISKPESPLGFASVVAGRRMQTKPFAMAAGIITPLESIIYLGAGLLGFKTPELPSTALSPAEPEYVAGYILGELGMLLATSYAATKVVQGIAEVGRRISTFAEEQTGIGQKMRTSTLGVEVAEVREDLPSLPKFRGSRLEAWLAEHSEWYAKRIGKELPPQTVMVPEVGVVQEAGGKFPEEVPLPPYYVQAAWAEKALRSGFEVGYWEDISADILGQVPEPKYTDPFARWYAKKEPLPLETYVGGFKEVRVPSATAVWAKRAEELGLDVGGLTEEALRASEALKADLYTKTLGIPKDYLKGFEHETWFPKAEVPLKFKGITTEALAAEEMALKLGETPRTWMYDPEMLQEETGKLMGRGAFPIIPELPYEVRLRRATILPQVLGLFVAAGVQVRSVLSLDTAFGISPKKSLTRVVKPLLDIRSGLASHLGLGSKLGLGDVSGLADILDVGVVQRADVTQKADVVQETVQKQIQTQVARSVWQGMRFIKPVSLPRRPTHDDGRRLQRRRKVPAKPFRKLIAGFEYPVMEEGDLSTYVLGKTQVRIKKHKR